MNELDNILMEKRQHLNELTNQINKYKVELQNSKNDFMKTQYIYSSEIDRLKAQLELYTNMLNETQDKYSSKKENNRRNRNAKKNIKNISIQTDMKMDDVIQKTENDKKNNITPKQTTNIETQTDNIETKSISINCKLEQEKPRTLRVINKKQTTTKNITLDNNNDLLTYFKDIKKEKRLVKIINVNEYRKKHNHTQFNLIHFNTEYNRFNFNGYIKKNMILKLYDDKNCNYIIYYNIKQKGKDNTLQIYSNKKNKIIYNKYMQTNIGDTFDISLVKSQLLNIFTLYYNNEKLFAFDCNDIINITSNCKFTYYIE